MTRILIIEDNELSMKLAVVLVKCSGYDILQAQNAEDGIRLAREHRPDLILMDIELPGMDGLAATRLLKLDIETRHIKIVAMTAYAMVGDQERCEEAGCDGYIDKPINIKKFISAVKEALGR